MIETSVGRVLFNQAVPKSVAFINEVLTKKALREIIADILKQTDIPTTADFLDGIKELGYVKCIPWRTFLLIWVILLFLKKKIALIKEAEEQIEQILSSYNMGLITNNERYNQVIDVWTNTNARLTERAMHHLITDRQGFNPIYMMLDSGATGF